MGEVSFLKAQGTGNDFVIIDLLQNPMADLFKGVLRSQFVKKLCRPKFGVSADGVVFIEPSLKEDVDFQWDFYNADGSPAEMCGNAARCVGLYGCQNISKKQTCQFQTPRGLVNVEMLGEEIRICFRPESLALEPFDVGLMEGVRRSAFIRVDVPHIVIEMNSWPVRKEHRPKIMSLRHHPSLGEEGANVTLMYRGQGAVQSVSYERGIEDFTLSCGTGVIAAVLFALDGASAGEWIDVVNPGGKLSVSADFSEGLVCLQGTASIIFSGKLGQGFLENEI